MDSKNTPSNLNNDENDTNLNSAEHVSNQKEEGNNKSLSGQSEDAQNPVKKNQASEISANKSSNTSASQENTTSQTQKNHTPRFNSQKNAISSTKNASTDSSDRSDNRNTAQRQHHGQRNSSKYTGNDPSNFKRNIHGERKRDDRNPRSSKAPIKKARDENVHEVSCYSSDEPGSSFFNPFMSLGRGSRDSQHGSDKNADKKRVALTPVALTNSVSRNEYSASSRKNDKQSHKNRGSIENRVSSGQKTEKEKTVVHTQQEQSANERKASSSLPITPGTIVVYEHNGSPLLGVVTDSSLNNIAQGKYTILNEDEIKLQLPRARLADFKLRIFPINIGQHEIISQLKNLKNQILAQVDKIDMRELWEKAKEAIKDYSANELCDLAYNNTSGMTSIAIYLNLIKDRVYFKRSFGSFFLPRTAESLERLFELQAERKKREADKEELIQFILQIGKNPNTKSSEITLPENLKSFFLLFAECAAKKSISKNEDLKLIDDALRAVSQDLTIKENHSREEKCYWMLKLIRFFRFNTNLPIIRHSPRILFSQQVYQEVEILKNGGELLVFDKAASIPAVEIPSSIEKSQQAIEERAGNNPQEPVLQTEYPQIFQAEAKSVPHDEINSKILLSPHPSISAKRNVFSEIGRTDLTSKFAFTVDDDSTKDADDAITIEQTIDGYTLGIHIADVASMIQKDSQLDREAKKRATSIYSLSERINMLPEILSEGILSLVPNEVRNCLTCELLINSSFKIVDYKLYPSVIKVKQKYSYEQAEELLDKGEHTFQLLYNIASVFEAERLQNGALKITKKDVTAYPQKDGTFNLVTIDEGSAARQLIGELMVIYNTKASEFAKLHAIPFPYRSQRKYEEYDDNHHNVIQQIPPEGPAYDYYIKNRLKKSEVLTRALPHSTLGLNIYSQLTSPIRRYLDLCAQRQLLYYICCNGGIFYNEDSLRKIIRELNDPLSKAAAITRESKRYWMLKYLEQKRKQHESFEGTVLKVENNGVVIELDTLFITSFLKTNLSKFKTPLKPGDRVKMNLAHVDAYNDRLRIELIQ
jgi:hypothetical protein